MMEMRCPAFAALLPAVAATASGQDSLQFRNRAEARIGAIVRSIGKITFFFSVGSGISVHNQIMGRVKLEYGRRIERNFYWGCTADYSWSTGSLTTCECGYGRDCCRNTVRRGIWKFDGMCFWCLPVVSGRLFFRAGAGVGAGLHRIGRIGDEVVCRTKLLPYLNLEGAWILRISGGCEMKFAPLLLFVPSEFSVSAVGLGTPTDVTPWLTDAGFTLTLGWRF